MTTGMVTKSSAHDALFRRMFSSPAEAASLLRDRVPPGAAQRIDWTSLVLQPGSFVDEELKWRHSDLLFRARANSGRTLLYVLVEHQSTIDRLMPFRVLRYMVRLYDKLLLAAPRLVRLPPIVPVVVHHGAREWSMRRDFHSIVDLGEFPFELPELVPQFRFVVDDLSVQDDEMLRRRALSEPAFIALWALKTLPRSENPQRDFRRVMDVVRALAKTPAGLDALTPVMHYSMEVCENGLDGIKQELRENIGRRKTEKLMSIAEKLREEGRAEVGAGILLKQLRLKFGPPSAATEKRVRNGSRADFERWGVRLMTAKTLAQVWGKRAPKTPKKR